MDTLFRTRWDDAGRGSNLLMPNGQSDGMMVKDAIVFEELVFIRGPAQREDIKTAVGLAEIGRAHV